MIIGVPKEIKNNENMARTSTFALTNATLPYAVRLADKGYEEAIKEDISLARGVNVIGGKVTHRAVAASLNLEYTSLDEIISVPVNFINRVA